MKKMFLIGVLVMIVLAMAVPAASAHSAPPGNNTTVTVYGYHNAGQVFVQGSGNNTSLYFGPKSKYNMALIGVIGCKNNTKVSFGYGAKGNNVGVMVMNPCH
jgi:hypothetical protein